jgi:hypothetical protein
MIGQALYAATAAASITSDLDTSSNKIDMSRLHLSIILFSRLLQGYVVRSLSLSLSLSLSRSLAQSSERQVFMPFATVVLTVIVLVYC